MTFAGGAGTDYVGFKDVFRAQAPWFHTQPRGVLMCERRYMTFVSGSDDGSGVSTISLAVGSDFANPAGQTYFRNFNNKGVGYTQMGTSGASNFRIDGWATALSGTAKPFTVLIAGQHPAGGNVAVGTCILSLNNSASVNSVVEVLMDGGVGTTSFNLTRSNDANSLSNTPSYDPGASPFVFYGAYDGTNLYSALNYGAVTTTAANAGALTLDKCGVGYYARGTNLPWQGKLVCCFFDTTAITGVMATSIRTYLCRLIGL